MKVILKPGEKLEVAFETTVGKEIIDLDGSIFIEFTFDELKVTADLPDSDNRSGVIYSERFNEPTSTFNMTPCSSCGRTTPQAKVACDRWDCPCS